ncbi:DUF308 domain-containing protein [Leucobacter sp. USHLN154]|uniref:DUF308 domain-containing protein n=1 Tax=unclassified Leucobacter TaxID=2621730 RepID=UPI00301966EB
MSQPHMPVPMGAGSSGPGSARRASPKGTVIAIGAIVALIGLGLVVWPFFSASWILVVLFGSALIANGAVLLARGGTIGGILLIVAGVVAMAFTGATARALVSFAGFGMIAFGALWLAVGMKFARSRPSIGIVPGAVLVVGGVLALIWPGVALSIAAVVGGIVLTAVGVAVIWGASKPRRVDPGSATIII